MFRRALLVVFVCALLVPSSALGQAFGPLPQAAPTPTPTPDQSNSSLTSDLGGRTTLFVIMGGLLVAFIGIGVFISRDARRALPKDRRPDHRLREEGPHAHKRQAKARARQRAKAQKVARRKNR